MMLQTKYQGSRHCGFRQEDFFMFLPIKAYVKHVTPEAGPFLAPGLKFEHTWYRSTGYYYIPNIKTLGLVVSDKQIFSCCSLYKPM